MLAERRVRRVLLVDFPLRPLSARRTERRRREEVELQVVRSVAKFHAQYMLSHRRPLGGGDASTSSGTARVQLRPLGAGAAIRAPRPVWAPSTTGHRRLDTRPACGRPLRLFACEFDNRCSAARALTRI